MIVIVKAGRVKYDGKYYHKNEEINMRKEVAKELIELGYVKEAVKEKAPEEENEGKEAGELDPQETSDE